MSEGNREPIETALAAIEDDWRDLEDPRPSWWTASELTVASTGEVDSLDVALMAACSPERVRALLDEIDRLRGAITRIQDVQTPCISRRNTCPCSDCTTSRIARATLRKRPEEA